MSDERQAWDQIPGEPDRWYKRFTRFRLMEPVRTIATVWQEESKSNEKRRSNAPGTWYEIARLWKWEERVATWDAFLDTEIEKEIASERKKILRTGLALQHKRVELLVKKAQQLIDITDTQSGIWVPDVKSIGTGKDAERVDLVQFNDAAFRELREYLTDIADEMGERTKKSEVALAILPKVYQGTDPDEDGTIE